MLGHTFLTPSPLPLLPSLAVGWSWRLVFLVLGLGSVLGSMLAASSGYLRFFP